MTEHVKMAGEVFNGRPGIAFRFLKQIQPGVLISLVAVGVGFLVNVNDKLTDQAMAVALLQRDVHALTQRFTAENAANVSTELHQSQIESIHVRIGELRERVGKLENGE